MESHTRAMIASVAFAYVTGEKVAGLYDHQAARNRRIATERRGDQVQGFDGDRGSSRFYAADVANGIVQVFDHAKSAWFAYDIQDAGAAQGYHRGVEAGR